MRRAEKKPHNNVTVAGGPTSRDIRENRRRRNFITLIGIIILVVLMFLRQSSLVFGELTLHEHEQEHEHIPEHENEPLPGEGEGGGGNNILSASVQQKQNFHQYGNYSNDGKNIVTVPLPVTPPPQSSLQNQENNLIEQQQRICFLAGPHKTGSTSIQNNLWRWTIPVTTYNFTDPSLPGTPLLLDIEQHQQQQNQNQKPIVNWIWPAPPFVVEKMKRKKSWQPGKAFYPLVTALSTPHNRIVTLHKNESYSAIDLKNMYHQEIQRYWDDGHSIVFGTEAMDEIVVKMRWGEVGHGLIQRFSQEVLPENMKGSQMTVVVMYRTPKIDHLISVWHQKIYRNYHGSSSSAPSFYEWVTKNIDNEQLTLKQLKALEMVDFLLEHTDWNVALIDLQGLKEEGWESSSFVACEILGEKCANKTPVELKRRRETVTAEGVHVHANSVEPVVLNVKKDYEPADLSREALDEMDDVLIGADCRLLHKFLKNEDDRGWHRSKLPQQKDDASHERLSIYFPVGMKKLMNRCNSLPEEYKQYSNQEMITNLVAVALRHGRQS